MIKILDIDVETTGRKHWHHGIHQIGGIVNVDDEVVGSFVLNMQPNLMAQIDPAALVHCNTTMGELRGNPNFHETFFKFRDILSAYIDIVDPNDKFILRGYNLTAFDIPFLQAYFLQNEDETWNDWFWRAPLDVMAIAAHYLRNELPKVGSFSLKNVAKYLNIFVHQDRLHTAGYDAWLAREVYYKLITNAKEI